MSNKIIIPAMVGAGIGFLNKKTGQGAVAGGLAGIGVGIVMNILRGDPGLAAPAGIGMHLRRSQQDREQRLPDFDLSTIPPYTGRVKYY